MHDPLTLLAVFCTGVMAAVIGTLVGGGGLLSIPFLMFIGLPPQMAIATDRMASLGQIMTALHGFSKTNKIRWEYVLIFSLLGLTGALIGVYILLNINPDIIQNIVAVIMLALLPLVLIKKDIGVARSKSTKLKLAIGFVLYMVVQTYAGFFGGGAGTLLMYVCMLFFGFSIIEVSATGLIPWSIMATASSIIFVKNGLVDYQFALALFLGMALGGHLGVKIALKKGEVWVKKIFAILVLAMAIKLLFF